MSKKSCSPLHSHVYSCNGRPLQVRWESCDDAALCVDSFDLPTISATSIALSSSYLSTFFLLLAASVAFTVLSELTTLLPATDDRYAVSQWQAFAEDLPGLLERVTCWSFLGLSIPLFTRTFHPTPHKAAEPPGEEEEQSLSPHSGWTKRWRRRLLTISALLPSCWSTAVGWVMAVVGGWYLTFDLFYYVWIGSPLLVTASLIFALLFPLSLVALWCRTSPHPPPYPSTSIDADPLADRSPFPPSPVSRWRAPLLALVMSVFLILPSVKYALSVWLPPPIGFSWAVNLLSPLLYLAAVFVLIAIGAVLLYRDRHRIARGEVHHSSAYFILILALQLCLPHFFYECWIKWAMTQYECSTSLWVQAGAVLTYHAAFALFQFVIQVFNLLAVGVEHCSAMVFYLQWFEDLMADLTFASVQPFSPEFFMYAAMATCKCLLRDSNLGRSVIDWAMQRSAAHHLQQVGALRKAPSVKSSGERGKFQRTGEGGEPLMIGEEEAGGEIPSASSSLPPLPSDGPWSALYSRYVQSFDLTLNRHQIFLCESSSKAILLTAIIFQYSPHSHSTLYTGASKPHPPASQLTFSLLRHRLCGCAGTLSLTGRLRVVRGSWSCRVWRS